MAFQGEDLIRESGVPYTIVRPCALTEEPAGADLIFDQGDNITVCTGSTIIMTSQCALLFPAIHFNKLVAQSQGKISREEVARICVAALASPNAVGKTFEVKTLQLVSKTRNCCQLSLRES